MALERVDGLRPHQLAPVAASASASHGTLSGERSSPMSLECRVSLAKSPCLTGGPQWRYRARIAQLSKSARGAVAAPVWASPS